MDLASVRTKVAQAADEIAAKYRRDFVFLVVLLAIFYLVCTTLVRFWTDAMDNHLPDKLRQDFRQGAASYALSMLHSLVQTGRGLMHFMAFWSAHPSARVQPPREVGLPFHSETMAVVASNRLLTAYLLLDMLIVLKEWPALGTYDVVLHHLGFLSVALFGTLEFCMPFQYSWLAIGELSTIFLNLRWFLIKTNHGSTQAMRAVNILFALTFFAVRVVLYLYGAVDLAHSARYLTRPSLLSKLMIFGGILGGLVLNTMWFVKIARIARASSPPTKPPPSSVVERDEKAAGGKAD